MPDNRNQKNLEWCHAYAFADLISFYAKKKISAYGVALESFRFWNINEKQGFGSYLFNPLDHFNTFQKNNTKLCTEKNFQVTNDEDWGRLSNAIRHLSHNKLDHASRICNRSYYDLMTGLDEKTLEALAKLSGQKFVQATLDIKCQERIEMVEGAFTIQEISYSNEMNNQIFVCIIDKEKTSGCVRERKIQDLHADFLLDEQINKKEPTIVFYDVDALKDKNGDKIRKNYNHFSVIVGRQYNYETKECEYLLRNSWGTDCTVYPERLKKRCTQGNFWISRQELLKSAGGLQVFEPK